MANRHDVVRLMVGDMTDDPFLSATGSVRRAIEASPVGGRVTLTRYVDDDSLVALYGAAVATVLPSLGGGFGLTIAESAACGTPVVASRLPALVELVGDAAIYVGPTDAADFAAGLIGVLEDPSLRRHLADASLERAASWAWGEQPTRLFAPRVRRHRRRGAAPGQDAARSAVRRAGSAPPGAPVVLLLLAVLGMCTSVVLGVDSRRVLGAITVAGPSPTCSNPCCCPPSGQSVLP